MPNRVSTKRDGVSFRALMDFPSPAGAPADIARLNEEMAFFLEERGVKAGAANSLQIALEELLTNIAKFGPAGLPAGGELKAELEVRLDGETISLLVSDNGGPFNPLSLQPPPLDADPMERPVGGLGVFMVRNMFERLDYERRDGWNRSLWTLGKEWAGNN